MQRYGNSILLLLLAVYIEAAILPMSGAEAAAAPARPPNKASTLDHAPQTPVKLPVLRPVSIKTGKLVYTAKTFPPVDITTGLIVFTAKTFPPVDITTGNLVFTTKMLAPVDISTGQLVFIAQ